MIEGKCICGEVRVTLAQRPDYINICNCRLCRSSGAAWGYFSPEQVQVDGKAETFRRTDIDPAVIDLHFCPKCSSVSHYTIDESYGSDRVGVNTRIFSQADLDGVEVRYLDARNVSSEEDVYQLTGDGHIGDGKAF